MAKSGSSTVSWRLACQHCGIEGDMIPLMFYAIM